MKRLALALEATRTSRSRLAKEAALADAFRVIGSDSSEVALATAVRFAAGRTLPAEDDRALGVGWSLLNECALAATGWSSEIVRASSRAAGELGEAFGLLLARVPGASERPGLELTALAALWDALAATGQRAAKRRLLDEVFARATPLEVKYVVRAIQGELRVGAQGGVVETAIGRAFDVPTEELRRAAALVTDPGELAVLACAKRLGEARLSIGRPVAYMLATPLETVATPARSALARARGQDRRRARAGPQERSARARVRPRARGRLGGVPRGGGGDALRARRRRARRGAGGLRADQWTGAPVPGAADAIATRVTVG